MFSNLIEQSPFDSYIIFDNTALWPLVGASEQVGLQRFPCKLQLRK